MNDTCLHCVELPDGKTIIFGLLDGKETTVYLDAKRSSRLNERLTQHDFALQNILRNSINEMVAHNASVVGTVN